jgi:hypothetical protein
LRGAGFRVLRDTGLSHDTGFQERLHQGEHTLSPTLARTRSIRAVWSIESKRDLDIRVQHLPIPQGAVEVDLGDRVVCPPQWPEAVGDRLEAGLEDRLQHQLQRRLDDPVGHGRNPEASQFPGSAWFGDLAFPHRQRPERGARPGVARDPVERHHQRRRIMHEVEQIVEPAGRIGRRPGADDVVLWVRAAETASRLA